MTVISKQLRYKGLRPSRRGIGQDPRSAIPKKKMRGRLEVAGTDIDCHLVEFPGNKPGILSVHVQGLGLGADVATEKLLGSGV